MFVYKCLITLSSISQNSESGTYNVTVTVASRKIRVDEPRYIFCKYFHIKKFLRELTTDSPLYLPQTFF